MTTLMVAMDNRCVRCGQPTGKQDVLLWPQNRRIHFACVRQDDTIKTLREAAAS